MAKRTFGHGGNERVENWQDMRTSYNCREVGQTNIRVIFRKIIL